MNIKKLSCIVLLLTVGLSSNAIATSELQKEVEAAVAETVSNSASASELERTKMAPSIFTPAQADSISNDPGVNSESSQVQVMLICIFGALVLSLITLSRDRSST